VRNFQMRHVAKLLEDHGVNVVFNGHAHNYQRTHPLRALAGVAQAPDTAGAHAVAIDTAYDGKKDTVPDGVLYIVEGAGGRDSHDSGGTSPRGNPNNVDEDDSATGTYTFGPGQTFPNGPAAWLDTHLTNAEMAPFIANAGAAPKITRIFKGRVFSFGHVIVDDNKLSLYQISEPLGKTSSATAANPTPYGTDINGKPVNDPIPDTLVDPTTNQVVSQAAVGTPVLLDAFTVTKPRLERDLVAELLAPQVVEGGQSFIYRLVVENRSKHALNGTQAVLAKPEGTALVGNNPQGLTEVNGDLVMTLGRLSAGEQRVVEFTLRSTQRTGDATATRKDDSQPSVLKTSATVRSATAMPKQSNAVMTLIRN
jgi:hypothetical protein